MLTHIAAKLDRIAAELEKIDPRLALAIDKVSDELEGEGKLTVGINSFVTRQTKSDFAGTKVTEAQLQKFRNEAEKTINAGQGKVPGKDFLRVVSVREPAVLCQIAEITPENKHLLQSETTKRPGEKEEAYEHSFFDSKDVKGIPSHHVDVICYSKEQLDKDGDPNTGSDFDIISINAQVTAQGSPMPPETIRRNMRGPASGGTKEHNHTPEELAHSEKFWSNHAMIK